MIALLAVMNCAQPNAASKAMSATMTPRSRDRPRPTYSVMLPMMATMRTGRRPTLSHRAPPTTCIGRVASSVTPMITPSVVIETPSLPLRYSVSYG